MREVVILGVGMHKFGRFPEKTVEETSEVAISNALKESGVPFKDIEAGYMGHCYQPMGTGRSCIAQFGETGIPIVNMEVACTSATQCVMRAAYEIATGLYDVVLAAGVEKMGRGLLGGATATGSYDEVMGLMVMPALYAMMARKHMKKYGTTVEQLALCSVKEHKYGALNPYAQYQKEMTLEEVMAGRMIADPINLYMCSPTTDGATAAVLCAKEKAHKYASKKQAVTIAGWAGTSGKYSKEGEMGGLREMAEKAFAQAGVDYKDIKVAQFHDAFSPGEIFIPESMGFIPEGEGGRWVQEGKTEINGVLPINTDGGLVSCGHPIGATGIRQIAELVAQLRGDAGPRQVPGNPKVAFQHNAGLGGQTVCIYKV